jgi:hypothetical protein
LAPSGHNTQPWIIRRVEPFHWIIGNDKKRWLPAVDPGQRETILSIGAFIQNIEYAAGHLGYACNFSLLALSNQDENMMEVKLAKTGTPIQFDKQKIITRRTVRSNYQGDVLKKEDINFLVNEEKDFISYIPNTSKEHNWINEQTIEANRLQAFRDDAQEELADWIRFSGSEAKKHCDGLTTASMEIEGFSAWVVRNFYGRKAVMKKDFRKKGIDKVKDQVGCSAGWVVITSKDNSTANLIETGRRMQRLFLKVREKKIALHPMTQILEEKATQQAVNNSLGISEPIQFLLRIGYLAEYPDPVSLRRPVSWFVKNG